MRYRQHRVTDMNDAKPFHQVERLVRQAGYKGNLSRALSDFDELGRRCVVGTDGEPVALVADRVVTLLEVPDA